MGGVRVAAGSRCWRSVAGTGVDGAVGGLRPGSAGPLAADAAVPGIGRVGGWGGLPVTPDHCGMRARCKAWRRDLTRGSPDTWMAHFRAGFFATAVVVIRHCGSGEGSGGVFHGDELAEGLKAGDEPLCLTVGVGAAVEVARAEVVVGFSGSSGHGPDDHGDRVGNGEDRLALGGGGPVAAVAGDVPVVERFQAAVVADRGPSDLDQDGLEIGVPASWADRSGACRADSWSPGQSPAQEAR